MTPFDEMTLVRMVADARDEAARCRTALTAILGQLRSDYAGLTADSPSADIVAAIARLQADRDELHDKCRQQRAEQAVTIDMSARFVRQVEAALGRYRQPGSLITAIKAFVARAEAAGVGIETRAAILTVEDLSPISAAPLSEEQMVAAATTAGHEVL